MAFPKSSCKTEFQSHSGLVLIVVVVVDVVIVVVITGFDVAENCISKLEARSEKQVHVRSVGCENVGFSIGRFFPSEPFLRRAQITIF